MRRSVGLRASTRALVLAACLAAGAAAAAPAPDTPRRARVIHTAELGVRDPAGLTWSRKARSLLLFSSEAAGQLVQIEHDGRPVGSRALAAALPRNVAFDNKAHRLLAYDARRQRLVVREAGSDGMPSSARAASIPARRYGVADPQGMAVDPVTGRIFLLDGRRQRIVVVEPEPHGGLRRATLSSVRLEGLPSGPLRGLAFDPSSGHLHVYRPADRRLYEVSDAGRVVAHRDLAAAGIRTPQALTFAPSGDQTDDPLATSLYVGEAASASQPGRIVELALASPASAQPESANALATLVQTIDTSLFSPASPDPMGIEYIDSAGRLLVSDSEVEEIPTLFTGDNLFDVDPASGGLVATTASLPYSDEPAGLAYSPSDGHLFISDDDANAVFEVDPGPDGIYGNADDAVTFFDTALFNSIDPEGVTYDDTQGVLYVADGLNAEIYEIHPGANGVFDGIAPGGDDQLASFDTAALGILDPEGIAYDWENGLLYVSGKAATTLYHITTSGTLVRTIDISVGNLMNPSGLAFGPGSQDPTTNHLYVSDRGVDNDTDPNENDGRIFEFAVPPITPGNLPPVVDAGPDQAIVLPAVATLEGSASDPLLSGGSLEIAWSHIAGPGSVSFADPSLPDTTASFTTAGSYVLRLTADDGELFASDDVTITVTGDVGETVSETPISASSDDAEEVPSGTVGLSSSDLEFTFDGSDQTVGMRFAGVDVPAYATILNAYVQFTVDEANTVPTSVVLEGESFHDAATFVSSPFNISSRPRTAAQVPWTPPPWTTAGEASPAQRTPNIASIIAEIVARPGWTPGNALVLIASGTGERTAISYDKDPSSAARLHVEYLASPNNPPAVSMSAPADGAGFSEGEAIAFAATASDPEDGDVTASLVWTSDLDGPIGTGGSFVRSDLSGGVHTLTATATDGGALEGWDRRTITVNAAPTVSLAAPPDGSVFNEGDPITFVGSATDLEDGDLTARLSWYSTVDGPIGSGGAFTRTDLTPGVHFVTAMVMDNGGLPGWAQLDLEVLVGCGGPDADGDGLADSCDNCINAANPTQTDSNGDGYGNACDADYDDDGVVGITDWGILAPAFGRTCADPAWDPDLDSDDDCVIGIIDFGVLGSSFGGAPGPSAFAP